MPIRDEVFRIKRYFSELYWALKTEGGETRTREAGRRGHWYQLQLIFNTITMDPC